MLTPDGVCFAVKDDRSIEASHRGRNFSVESTWVALQRWALGRDLRQVPVSRGELYLTAVELLQEGHSLEIAGDRGSGRTSLLRRIREHFKTLGWQVVEVAGFEAFRQSQLMALGLAGVSSGAETGRLPSLLSAYAALSDAVRDRRTVVLVDDSEYIDESSWGVIEAVSSKLGVPVAYARLRTRTLNLSRPAPSVTARYTVELEPMNFSELEASLETQLSVNIEPGTMSRLFAKSGGNVGVAFLLFDAARRAGTITVEDGVAQAIGSLWTPALKATVESLLRELSTEELEALRSLALLGTVDFATAVRVVSEELVLRLEERQHIVVVASGDTRTISVNPPIVVEYFRHGSLPGHRSALIAEIGGALAKDVEVSTSAPKSRASATRIRLVHERIRLRTLQAREEWSANPNLQSAVGLLLALEQDSGNTVDEVSTLSMLVRQLEGSEQERADWEIAYWTYTARSIGDPKESLAELEAAALGLPGEALRLRAAAVNLSLLFGLIPAEEPFPFGELDEIPERSRPAVLLARASWLIITGNAVGADALLAAHSNAEVSTPELDALVVYCQLAMDNYEFAYTLAERRLQEAHLQSDGTRIRIYSFLSALCAISAHRLDDAEATALEAAPLGLPPGQAPISFVGLTLMEAFFAARHGQRAAMTQHLEDLERSGLPDGVFPLQSRALVLAHAAAADGDSVAAARMSVEAGDELWDRGIRLAAAWCYLEGVRSSTSKETWEHIRPRVLSLQSPNVLRTFEFFESVKSGDAARAIQIVEVLEGVGRYGEAAYCARVALGAFAEDGNVSAESIARLRHVAQTAAGSVSRPSLPSLTAREYEVAELVAAGLTNPMIAEVLFVSVRTVESHVNKLMKKVSAKRRHDIREYLLASGAQISPHRPG
ncbi:LuxR family transcriptional regulator [Leucobacter iarius]